LRLTLAHEHSSSSCAIPHLAFIRSRANSPVQAVKVIWVECTCVQIIKVVLPLQLTLWREWRWSIISEGSACASMSTPVARISYLPSSPSAPPHREALQYSRSTRLTRCHLRLPYFF
jgi:hypothetical protein